MPGHLVPLTPGSAGGYDSDTLGRPCRSCGSDLWVATSLCLMCGGKCRPRRLLDGEKRLGFFDAAEYRATGQPRILTTAEARRRGYRLPEDA